jgi:hypothetical protein
VKCSATPCGGGVKSFLPSGAAYSSSPPGLTRWSMRTRRESNNATILGKRKLCMDCRVKPGNDVNLCLTRVSSLRGASATKQSSFPRKPLDCFADARNDDAKNRSRNASASEFIPPPRFRKNRLSTKGRRSAERRMLAIAARHQTNITACRCLGRGGALFRARPPSGASTAALIRDCDISDSASGHASWDVDSA